VLRALWNWREQEAEAADRPAFHILQNQQLLDAAVEFVAGKIPAYRHFSSRRREIFRGSAEAALKLPEEKWPVMRRRSGTRPTSEVVRRADELKHRRDRAAVELKLEPTLLAPRNTLVALAADETRAATMLAPWQRKLLGLQS
jgi:ribonuclease D